MAEINPFDLIKLGNDPSLTQRTVNSSANLEKLMASQVLASQNNTALGARQSASDLSRANASLAPHGLNSELIQQPDVLSRILGQIGGLRGAQTAKANVSAGLRLPQGSGPLKPGDTFNREFTPGFELPGVAANKALAEATRTQGNKKTRKGLVLPKPDQIGLQTETEESTDELKAKGKNTSQVKTIVEKALGSAGSYDRLIAQARLEYPNATEILAAVAPNGKVYLYVDGSEPIPVNP